MGASVSVTGLPSDVPLPVRKLRSQEDAPALGSSVSRLAWVMPAAVLRQHGAIECAIVAERQRGGRQDVLQPRLHQGDARREGGGEDRREEGRSAHRAVVPISGVAGTRLLSTRRRGCSSSATRPDHPVWCDAPSPAPSSPLKYSWNGRWSRKAGSVWNR